MSELENLKAQIVKLEKHNKGLSMHMQARNQHISSLTQELMNSQAGVIELQQHVRDLGLKLNALEAKLPKESISQPAKDIEAKTKAA